MLWCRRMRTRKIRMRRGKRIRSRMRRRGKG